MMALQVRYLRKEYEGVPAVTNISFHVAAGEKVGLVGANGCGKSTVMKILAGEMEATGGSVHWVHENFRRAYMSQLDRWIDSIPLGEQLGEIPDELLSRCGITKEMLKRPAGSLSGGQKTRAALAQALAGRPEVLLLDEPTNHLDTDALQWLESMLASYPGAVLVVSHDRYFLDKVVTRIVEIKDGATEDYIGNYSAYTLQKEAERAKHESDYRHYLKEKKHLEAAIDRERRWAMTAHTTKQDHTAPKNWKDYVNRQAQAHMRTAKSMEKKLEWIKVEKPRDPLKVNLRFDQEASITRNLIEARDLGFSYDGRKWLYKGGNFYVQRGNRVGIVGPNGSGKTTLIKVLLGELPATEGAVRVSPVKVGYLAQELETLNEAHTVLQEAAGGNGAMDQAQVRTLLACLLFDHADILKPVAVLSGGERLRLALAKLILTGPDILVLDEPTNGLDLPSRERVEEALADYDGTLLLVSHDRYLLKRLVDRVLSVKGGRLAMYPGTYDEYVEADVKHKEIPKAQREKELKEQCLLIELRLARLGAELAAPPPDQAEALNAEFIQLSRQLRQLKG